MYQNLKVKTFMPFKDPLSKDKSDYLWRQLGDNALLYGDNGGDSDGSAYLPSQPLNDNDEGVSKLVDASYGELVDVNYYDRNDWDHIGEMLSMYGDLDPIWYAEEDGTELTYSHMMDALDNANSVIGWAGFGNGEIIVIIWR